MRVLAATAIGLGLFLTPIPTVSASPLCEHRGITHVERHGGTIADREYHLARGERVSCGPEDTDPHPVVTPSAPTTYVPVPQESEGDDGIRWHIGRDRHRWWRDD